MIGRKFFMYYKNKALGVLLVFNSVFVFASSLLGPLYAVFVETIDSKLFSVSLSWAVFLFSTVVFMLFVRRWSDNVIDKRHLLMMGYLLRALVWFVFPVVSNLSGLILLQIVLGLGEAVGTPAYEALYAENLDDGKHIREFTDRKLLVYLCEAVGVLIGGYVAVKFGFSWLFLIMGILALVSFIGIALQPRELLCKEN